MNSGGTEGREASQHGPQPHHSGPGHSDSRAGERVDVGYLIQGEMEAQGA